MPDSHSKYAAVTIVSMRYLALARVTGHSFKQHNPDADFYILLADEPVADAFVPADTIFRFLHVSELALDAPESVFFKYSELELSYALTPTVIKHLLNKGYAGVLFLKQETLVIGDLGAVISHLDSSSVLLTPHLLAPIRHKNGVEWELNVLQAGIFNGGFIGFADNLEARTFLDWWEDKTLESCVREVENGLHFEQRWLDFVPSFVSSYMIIRDPGINVGHWNLLDRDISVCDGQVFAQGVACRVFRFSGYDPASPELLTKYNKELSIDKIGDAAQVLRHYQTMLDDAGYVHTMRLSYTFDRFDNGVQITDEMRKIYRELGANASRFGNPFQTNHADNFYHWLSSEAALLHVE